MSTTEDQHSYFSLPYVPAGPITVKKAASDDGYVTIRFACDLKLWVNSAGFARELLKAAAEALAILDPPGVVDPDPPAVITPECSRGDCSSCPDDPCEHQCHAAPVLAAGDEAALAHEEHAAAATVNRLMGPDAHMPCTGRPDCRCGHGYHDNPLTGTAHACSRCGATDTPLDDEDRCWNTGACGRRQQARERIAGVL